MLIHPWDAASEAEWRAWIDAGHDFGQLVGNGSGWPVVVPTHFVLHDGELLVHLARPNPIRKALEQDRHVVLSVQDDYAFIPSDWRVADDHPRSTGVPTSYYSAVHFHCLATLVDDPHGKAEILTRQLAHFQPSGGHGEVAADSGPYHRMLPGIFGIRLEVVEVRAKFKYDDHKPADLRRTVSDRLEERGHLRDVDARRQQQARLARPAPSVSPK